MTNAIDNVAVANDDNDDENVDGLEHNNNRASTEAGAVRGVARSVQNVVGQRLVKFPAMGRLPAPKVPSAPPSSFPSSLSSISKSSSTGAAARMRLPKNIPKPRVGSAGSAGARVSGSASARATARSAGRKMPSSSVPPKSIPVRQVAKISDRMSTGLDVFDTAQETGVSWRLSRVVSFAITMGKNTLLGAAVFETYCYAVEKFAPPAIDTNSSSSIGMHRDSSGDDQDDDDTTHDINPKSSLDAYARASPLLHTVAGTLGGGVHGIVGTLWDTAAWRFGTTSTTSLLSSSSPLVSMPRMTLHHGMAHGALFGSYELSKRTLLQSFSGASAGFDATSTTTTTSLHDAGHTHGYLACVIVAGGLAGQVQHVMSHYTEQWLRLEEGPGAVMMEEATSTSSSTSKPMTTNILKFRPPVLRSVLMAFPASAVGFVAFEYGRSIGSAN
ncbi:hypothetical protein MHU86_2382 [Fragilaria crotonensis]|nr:hypothetical protein MHU86_2382 [Fragilaria crotonensis]